MTVLLLLAQETLRRAKRWAVWGAFFLMPLILTPYWLRVNELGLFPWFKFYTIFFCVCWGTAAFHIKLGNPSLGSVHHPRVARMVEHFRGGDGRSHSDTARLTLLNAAADLLLITTMPYGTISTRIDSAELLPADLALWNQPAARVIGYTLWNWTFVSRLNLPIAHGPPYCRVLAAGLIVAMNDPRRWSH